MFRLFMNHHQRANISIRYYKYKEKLGFFKKEIL